MYKTIIRCLFLFILVGALSTGIDYARIIAGETPVFNIKSYNEKTHIQRFRGLFYIAERKVKNNVAEHLVDSSEIKFKVLTLEIDVPKQFKEQTFEFSLETKNEETCQTSKLIYADRAIKIYTYCLEEVTIVDNTNNKKDSLENYLKNDYTIIDDIDSKLLFLGTVADNTQGSTGNILRFKSAEDKFTNKGLELYRCNKLYVNDVYIAPKGTGIIEDFCKYKDDDFYFMYEITIDPLPEGVEEVKAPEPFWEDEINRYEFETVQKDRVFITTPGVRGRAPKKLPLNQVLTQNILTLEQLSERGLKYNTINKEEERQRLEAERLAAEAQNAQNQPTA